MEDNNDINKLRRKRISSNIQELSSTSNEKKIRIKKQASSGDENSNIINLSNRRNRKVDSTRRSTNRSIYREPKRNTHDKKNNEYEEYDEYYEDYDDYDDYDEDYDNTRGGLIFRIVRKIFLLVIIISIIGGSATFLYVRSVVNDMPVLTKKMVRESYINKEPVVLARIPANLQKAVIAIEDHRFYEHNGTDYRSFIRSFINNIFGGSTQGASTIDMQLSKNLLTNNEKTLKRKIQDIHNAHQLNKIMTKDEILEAYLNNIYLGKSAYGVQAGAQLYFGKDVSNLTFGESTMLAGITNNPSLYQNYEQAKKRQAVVLLRMYKLGYIKENVYKAQMYRDTPFKSEIDQ